MASVTLTQVTKVFSGGVTAVAPLDLHIDDGEFLVIVGPSGCGKSTTLRLIAGLETATSGRIAIDDRMVNGVPPRNRDVAMVFQDSALYPHMTVRRNLAFALKMRKTPKVEIAAQVGWAAWLLKLETLLDRKPAALSGGQRQRVALGRAMVRRPAVFLFDEPLSNLDARLRVEMRTEIKQLHRQVGATTIYVTHDQEEAMTLGDRVAVLHEGRMHQCAPPLDLYARPVDRLVASIVGMPPMNFIKGRLQRTGDHTEFATCDGALPVAAEAGRLLAESTSRAVVAGVRPEAISLSGSASPDGPGLTATVQIVEPLGSQIDVVVETPSGGRLICRMPARPIAEADQVVVTTSSESVYLFDPAGAAGRNLLLD